MTTKDGGTAFPAYEHVICDREDSKGPVRVITGQPHGGMKLRDWFAGQALISLADPHAAYHDQLERIAAHCYEMADAMLKAREPQ